MSTRVESGNAELEVRLGAPESPAGAVGVALLAHPLGWLGGSMDDPVMVRVEQALGRRGWYTVSFNSRGVGSSTGSPSWTGAAECDDMAAVLAYATSRHLDLLPHPHPHPYPRQLLLVGYSAGALYTSTLSPPEGWHTRVVLLSYPRDYIWALSLFQSARFTRGIDHLVASKTRLLFIHGTQDQFSKHKKFQDWTNSLRARADRDSAVTVVTVHGADHFWRSSGTMRTLLDSLVSWLDS